MNTTQNARGLVALFAFTYTVMVSTACNSVLDGSKETDLASIISIQSTQLADLSTQVAQQELANQSQWEAISYLSTQMPYVMGSITPVPPGSTIKPTPYSLEEPDGRKTPTPTPSASIDIEYPPDTRSGIDEIDIVLDAILEQENEARLDLARFTTCPCTTADGLGGPPKCQSGEKDGTLVEAFPILYSEGTYVRPENIRGAFDFTVRGLAAIYQTPDDAYESGCWPARRYGIIFTSEDGAYPHIITVLVENGQIVRLDFDPSWPPFDAIWKKSDNFILPPIR